MFEKDRVIKKAPRITNASVLHVKLATGELTIWRKKHEPGRIIDMLTTFFDEAKLQQMIRERAYYIWEKKGKPAGQDWATWIQAEKQIRAKSK